MINMRFADNNDMCNSCLLTSTLLSANCMLININSCLH